MPNHIQNKLKITGKDFDIQKVLDHIKGEDCEDGTRVRIDFNKIIPMPNSLHIDSDSWVSLIESQFSDSQSIKSFLDKVTNNRNFKFKYDDSVDKQVDNFAKGIKNYLKHGYASWYGWACKHWETKWNAYQQNDRRDTENVIFFQTAWAAPLELIKKLSKMFPAVTIDFKFSSEDTGYYGAHIKLKNGGLIFENTPEKGSKAAYGLAFELWPGRKENYTYLNGKYVCDDN